MQGDSKARQAAVALVIYNATRRRLLIVKRPPDDDRLPNVWGLPAGSVRAGEAYEDAAARTGREKLGVEVNVIRQAGEGDVDRGDYILHMKVYEAEIIEGTPEVPQPVTAITQYVDWRWGETEELAEAARKGSLCCRVYLSSVKRGW